jgi:hypothetical protein
LVEAGELILLLFPQMTKQLDRSGTVPGVVVFRTVESIREKSKRFTAHEVLPFRRSTISALGSRATALVVVVGVCQIEQLPRCPLWDSARMKMRDMSPELFNSVPCPTCHVGPGKRCLLHSGGLRVEPHVDRKLAAMEAVELKRIHLVEGGSDDA